MQKISGGAVLAACLLCASAASAQYAGWGLNRKITMNTTASGAGVTADVKGFPVAVNLNQGNFDFAQAKPDGSDLRFASAAGSPLPYEIESWDATAKKAAVWVKTDVKGNDNAQSFTMYWGNAAATTESDGAKVFSKDEGWVSAWHLAEKGSTTAGGYKDATANAKNGTGVNISGDATADGPIGPAVNLTRTRKEYIVIPGSEGGVYTLNTSATYSIWVNARSQGIEYQAMFSKGEAGFRIHYYGVATWDSNKGKYIVETCLDPGDQCAPPKQSPPSDIKPGTWFLLALVHAGGQEKFYVNGKLLETVGAGSVNSGGEPVTIGNNEKVAGGNSRNRSHDGLLDEARVLGVGKDANWMKLDYESQHPGNTFLNLSGSTAIRHSGLVSPLSGATALIRRCDLQGRLVATVRSSGDARADQAELAKHSQRGLYFDSYVSASGTAVRKLRVMLP